jgi:crossover junction endodeoxyribonuclease RusA
VTTATQQLDHVEIALPWISPPLTLNQRLHWTAEHREKQAIKQAVAILARQRIASLLPSRSGPVSALPYPVRIVLWWTVTDRQRRDTDNLGPTLKAAIDGLVHAKLLPDDNWLIVPISYPQIELGPKQGLRLEITRYDGPGAPRKAGRRG